MTTLRSLSLLAAALGALAAAAAQDPGAEGLGRIDFPTSGDAAAQPAFVRGMLLLHSFEYEDAREAFREARRIDPDFALAYWGEALTHSHPIWRQEDVAAARAALRELAPTPQERQAKAKTARERGLVAAADVLFGEGTRAQRHDGYERALAALASRFPDDLEIRSLWALSILGTSIGGRDTATYMRAAAVGEEVYERDRDHPGALHYLIHSYDDPVHAPLGLRMARRYDRVAPAAQHALHMPSHIYVALGMWDESAGANVASVAAADARRERKGLGIDARGWHSFWWLHYSELQRGRWHRATELLREMARDAAAADSRTTRYHLAVMRAAHLVETERWDGFAADLEVGGEGLRRTTEAIDQYARGMAALRRGDRERAKARLAELRVDRLPEGDVGGGAAATCCAPVSEDDPAFAREGRQVATVLGLELEAELALAADDDDAALALLRRAAAVEAAMDGDFGPPSVVKPAHERLGEVLLELGRPADAVVALESALARAPRRARAMLALTRALAGAGNAERAAAVRGELARMWQDADDDVQELLASAAGTR